MWHSTEKLAAAISTAPTRRRGKPPSCGCPPHRWRCVWLRQVQSLAASCGLAHAQHGIFPRWASSDLLKGLRPKNRLTGAFGSYGGRRANARDRRHLKAMNMDVLPSIDFKFVPTVEPGGSRNTVARRRVGEGLSALGPASAEVDGEVRRCGRSGSAPPPQGGRGG